MTPAITLLGSMIRTVDHDGLTYFMASDCCHALGHHDVPKALALYCKETPTFVDLWPGIPRQFRALCYDDVLRLINASKRPDDHYKIKNELGRASQGLKCYRDLVQVPILKFPEQAPAPAPAQTQLAPVEVVMTSHELVDYINNHRSQQAEAAGVPFPSKGFAKLRHDDLLRKVPKVLGEGVRKFSDTHVDEQNGQTYPGYRFPKREACLMAMSYSYEIQAKVFDRMTELEAQLTAQPQQQPNPLSTQPLQDLLAIHAALLNLPGIDPTLLTERTLAAIGQATGLPTNLIAQALPTSTHARDQLQPAQCSFP